jgi:DNA-binding NtrC family response regulator
MLIGDNNHPYLMVMKEFFEAEGFEIDMASSSTAVRLALERQQFAVAILDVPLDDHEDEQDISGLLVAKTVSTHTPLIIFTSYPSVEAVQAALGANIYGLPAAVDFISKDEGLEVLREAVRNILDSEGVVLDLSVEMIGTQFRS